MKKLVIALLLLIISGSASALNQWSSMSCVGTDTVGQSIYLSAYSDSSFVNINGHSYRIVGKTQNGLGVVTENFITTTGVLVYDSLVPLTTNVLVIYQFNAITQRLLAQASLSCRVSGNSAFGQKVKDQRIFDRLS